MAIAAETAAVQLSDPGFAWPASVSTTIPLAAEEMRAIAAHATSVASVGVWGREDPLQLATNVSPTIRAALGLPPPKEGC
jgi:hypothetical protein